MPPVNENSSKTRRAFLQAGAASAAGVGLAPRVAAAPPTALALNGGSKSVSFPADRFKEITRWPRYGAAEKATLIEMIHTGRFYQELPLLEKDWQDFTKAPFVKSHMNGTGALTAMYFALDLPPGSEIMVPSHTFWATIVPMRLFGLVPIFVDIDPRTGNFDAEYAAKVLTPQTKAVVPVHYIGLPCEMDRIEEFTKKHGLILLEDAAHAQGATMQGRSMGTWGVMGMTSFQATKPLPAIEGGMGMYQAREYYERATAFGHYDLPSGFPKDSRYRTYDGTGFGQKYRMHPFAATVLRSQLRKLPETNEGIRRRVRSLNDRLTQLPGISEPRCRPDQNRIYYAHNQLFFDERKAGFSKAAAMKALRAEGVPVTASGEIQEQHKYRIYSEAKWWHHAPRIPDVLPGHVEMAKNEINMPLLFDDAPELIDQYVKAYEKVWAHKEELSKQ